MNDDDENYRHRKWIGKSMNNFPSYLVCDCEIMISDSGLFCKDDNG